MIIVISKLKLFILPITGLGKREKWTAALLFKFSDTAQNRLLDKLFHSKKKHSQSMAAQCF